MIARFRPLTATVVLGLALAATASPGQAGSIYAKAAQAGARPRSVYSDDTARDVGDVLTVVIDERSVVENDTSRNRAKSSSRSAAMTGTVDLTDLIGQTAGTHTFSLPEIDLSASDETKFSGSATFDTDRKVVDKITVAVEDVLPNGNLVVLGTRYREVDGEKQTVQISGIVRGSDISFENTVESHRVADFRLVVTIRGPENQFTWPGWLNAILNAVNPF